jgi:hypothetical protein
MGQRFGVGIAGVLRFQEPLQDGLTINSELRLLSAERPKSLR